MDNSVVNRGIENVETCLLISPGIFTVSNEFLVNTVALAPGYVQTGKAIVVYINGKKYIEKLEAQCVPFCKLVTVIRLSLHYAAITDYSFELYANGDVYLCGMEFRRK